MNFSRGITQIMGKWKFRLCSILVLLLLTLQACDNKRVLINGKNNFLLDYDPLCKLEVKSHFLRETFLRLEVSPTDCNIKINNLNEWIKELTEANGLEPGSIKIDKKNKVSNRNSLTIERNKKLGFTVIKRSDSWNNGKTGFIFPKSDNISCNGRALFKEEKELFLEMNKMRFIF